MRKLRFIYKKLYQYYYDIQETMNKPEIAEVDLPEFIYDEQIRKYEKRRKETAKKKTRTHIEEILKKGKLNRCYSRKRLLSA